MSDNELDRLEPIQITTATTGEFTVSRRTCGLLIRGMGGGGQGGGGSSMPLGGEHRGVGAGGGGGGAADPPRTHFLYVQPGEKFEWEVGAGGKWDNQSHYGQGSRHGRARDGGPGGETFLRRVDGEAEFVFKGGAGGGGADRNKPGKGGAFGGGDAGKPAALQGQGEAGDKGKDSDFQPLPKRNGGTGSSNLAANGGSGGGGAGVRMGEFDGEGGNGGASDNRPDTTTGAKPGDDAVGTGAGGGGGGSSSVGTGGTGGAGVPGFIEIVPIRGPLFGSVASEQESDG